jgi:hypothetical protein
MTALLDTDIRNALAAILDTAPPIDTTPPSDLQLVATELTTKPTRWLAAAAAIIILVAGLGWVSQRQTGEQPVTSEPTIPIDDDLAGLRMLPRVMPAGWQLVDMDIFPPSDGTQQTGNLVVLTQTDGDARAIVSLDSTGDAAPDPADQDLLPLERAVWDPMFWTMRWIADGQGVGLTSVGLDEAQARTLAASLVPIETTAGRSFTVPPASGFTVERQYLINGTSFPNPGSTSLTFTDPDGNVSTVSITQESTMPNFSLLLYLPTPPTATAEVASATGVAGLVRLVDGSVVTTYPDSQTVSAELRTIFDSLEPADAASWATARRTIANAIAATPTLAQGDALDVTVSVHRSQAVSGLCITRGDQTGCDWVSDMSASGQMPIAAGGETASIVLPDGSWYVVSVSADGTTCPLNTATEQSQVTIAGQTLVITHPNNTTTQLLCEFDFENNQPTGYFGATRPI